MPVAYGDHLERGERRSIERNQRVRQGVRSHHEAAIRRHRDVAHIDARAHLAHHAQVVKVVLRHPAIARAKVDEAAVGRKFRSAVQRVARREARQRLEPIAVQDRRVMVTDLDHDEEVHRVGRILRSLGVGLGDRMHDAGGADVGHAPARRLGGWRGDVVGKRADLTGREFGAEPRHLRRHATVGDHRECGLGAQSLQVLGQERRPGKAETRRTVAHRAVLRRKAPAPPCIGRRTRPPRTPRPPRAASHARGSGRAHPRHRLAAVREHRHALIAAGDADFLVAEVTTGILFPGIAGELQRAYARVAAADVENAQARSAPSPCAGAAFSPAMIGSLQSAQICENGRSRTLPSE